MAETIEELKAKIKELEKANAYLQNKVEQFEDGDLSLYHAVQRKMKELSKVLNKHSLDTVDIEKASDKTFDRISAILEKCEKYALSANALGSRLGINSSEITTTVTKSRITPESMADNIGELAGQRQ